MDGHLNALALGLAAACSLWSNTVSAQALSLPEEGVHTLQLGTRSPSFAVVDMPVESTPPGVVARRPRHALRMRSEMAQSVVRSLGIDAQECAMLLRVHSRAASNGSGSGFVINPQMHLSCRF